MKIRKKGIYKYDEIRISKIKNSLLSERIINEILVKKFFLEKMKKKSYYKILITVFLI